jgi:diamine N-acetyltransferase
MNPVQPLITLRPLSQENARAVLRLRVAPDQASFVASNADSIADAYVHRELRPLAVYACDDLVGFAMYGQDPDDGRWWIIRMMIDARFQGRGYGRGAMEELIGLMREEHRCESIRLGVDPANHRARRLYELLGFRDTGEVHYDEIVMCLECAE